MDAEQRGFMILDLESKNVTSHLNPDLQEQNQMSQFILFIYLFIYIHTYFSLFLFSHD